MNQSKKLYKERNRLVIEINEYLKKNYRFTSLEIVEILNNIEDYLDDIKCVKTSSILQKLPIDIYKIEILINNSKKEYDTSLQIIDKLINSPLAIYYQKDFIKKTNNDINKEDVIIDNIDKDVKKESVEELTTTKEILYSCIIF